MLWGLANKAFDHKLNSVDLVNHLIRRIEDGITWRWHVRNTTGTVLDNQGFIAPVEVIVQ